MRTWSSTPVIRAIKALDEADAMLLLLDAEKVSRRRISRIFSLAARKGKGTGWST